MLWQTVGFLFKEITVSAGKLRFRSASMAAAGLLVSCWLMPGCQASRVPRLAESWRTGALPQGLALSDDESQLAVACSGSNDVWLYDLLSANHASRRFDVEKNP